MSKNRAAVAAVTIALLVCPRVGHPETAPAAPILLLEGPAEYGNYTAEILRAEGFNEFQVDSLAAPDLTPAFLSHFDTVILTEAKLNAGQTSLLSHYVRNGGNLIAFRPDPQLASVFGISETGSTTTDGYVKIEPDNDLGKGLTSETLQFHGDADQFDLKGANVVAHLYRDANTSLDKPAVVSHEFGKGHAVAFSYNLPKSIVLARQGNNRYAGLEKDGIKGIRAADMFTGGWINPDKTGLNQADEQMRLLSHAIEQGGTSKKPLPRFWYFPGLSKSLILLTSDGESSPEKDFDDQLADVKSKGARMTLYLISPYVSVDKVKSWLADGFEISGHVDDTREAINPTFAGMNARIKSTVDALKDAYGVTMRTVRNHWIVWCGRDADDTPDFAAQASIEAKYGIHLDCNYYHFDQESREGHFLGPVGNFTGSGLPMKFITPGGEILDIYQSLTQLPDEQWNQGNLFNNFKILLDRSLDREDYTFINVNLHTDRWRKWSRQEGLQIMDYANLRKVPMWTANRALDFLQARDAADFSAIDWSDNRLSFQLVAPASGPELTLMVPKMFGGKTITHVLRNGKSESYTVQSIKGSDYALVVTASGDQRFVVTYGQAEEKSKP